MEKQNPCKQRCIGILLCPVLWTQSNSFGKGISSPWKGSTLTLSFCWPIEHLPEKKPRWDKEELQAGAKEAAPGTAGQEGLSGLMWPFGQLRGFQSPDKPDRLWGKGWGQWQGSCCFWELERAELLLPAATAASSSPPSPLMAAEVSNSLLQVFLTSLIQPSPPLDPQTTIIMAETAWPWLLPSPSVFRQQMALEEPMCEAFSCALTTALIMQHCH